MTAPKPDSATMHSETSARSSISPDRGADTRCEKFEALPPRLRCGDRLEDLRIDAEISQGATATVYRAHPTAREGVVAVKVLSPHLALVPSAITRFKAESVFARRLSHPGVIKVFEDGVHAGHYYYSMQLQDDKTALALRELDEVGTREDFFGIVAGLFANVARGVQALHETGILHRDIKPANLLLSKKGQLVLCDFGSALDQRHRDPVLERATASDPDFRYDSMSRFGKELERVALH